MRFSGKKPIDMMHYFRDDERVGNETERWEGQSPTI